MRRASLSTMIDAAILLLDACRERGLRCRDPPLVTGRVLQRLELNQYQARAFWEDAEELSREDYVIYRYRAVTFSLRLSLTEAELMHVDGWVPVDYLECRANSGRCERSPRGRALYAYVIGKVEGGELKVNGMNILRVLDVAVPGLARELLEGARDVLWGRGSARLLGALMNALKLESVRLVLPETPDDESGLMKLSPLLSRLTRQAGP